MYWKTLNQPVLLLSFPQCCSRNGKRQQESCAFNGSGKDQRWIGFSLGMVYLCYGPSVCFKLGHIQCLLTF